MSELEILIGVLAGLVNAALYACALVVYQSQSSEVTPFITNCIKTWVPFPIMGSIILLFYSSQLYSTPILSIVLLSLSMFLGTVIADTAYLASQERIGVSNALPIAMTYPIFTYAIAVVFLSEGLFLSRTFGIVLAVIGVIAISREKSEKTDETQSSRTVHIVGVALAMSTAVLYAASTLFIQIGISDIDPVVGTFIRFFSGSLIFIPLFLVAKSRRTHIPARRTTKIVAVVSVFESGIASLLYVTSVKYVGAVISSVLGTTTSLFGIPVSVSILGERLTRMDMMAVLATIIGVILVLVGF